MGKIGQAEASVISPVMELPEPTGMHVEKILLCIFHSIHPVVYMDLAVFMSSHNTFILLYIISY
jgi:hypothetical protein